MRDTIFPKAKQAHLGVESLQPERWEATIYFSLSAVHHRLFQLMQSSQISQSVRGPGLFGVNQSSPVSYMIYDLAKVSLTSLT